MLLGGICSSGCSRKAEWAFINFLGIQIRIFRNRRLKIRRVSSRNPAKFTSDTTEGVSSGPAKEMRRDKGGGGVWLKKKPYLSPGRRGDLVGCSDCADWSGGVKDTLRSDLLNHEKKTSKRKPATHRGNATPICILGN